MNIDDRLAAITMNLELLSRDREEDKAKIQALFLLAEQQLQAIREQNQALDKDAKAIRALARIAENHERRLSITEGFTAVEPNEPTQ